MSKRFLRVIGYEGNPDWIDGIVGRLNKEGQVTFSKQGTIKEVYHFFDDDIESVMKAINKR